MLKGQAKKENGVIYIGEANLGKLMRDDRFVHSRARVCKRADSIGYYITQFGCLLEVVRTNATE